MRIAYLEIENFRGIKSLEWAPSPGMNCLIGPGDSTKTTILDAIELCLNPRSYTFADDCDFFDLDIDTEVRIVVTFVDLPSEFKAEDRYGLHLRGWNRERKIVEDEPGAGLEEALSVVGRSLLHRHTCRYAPVECAASGLIAPRTDDRGCGDTGVGRAIS
jgi:putative ATP-dependent endonuclease of OLD family